MYKHVAKQQRLNAKNLEAHLSDEDSSGDEEDVEMKAQASASGSESGSDEDGEEEDEEELLPAEEEEEEEAEALAPPPPGFPTAQAALEDPIVDLALATGEEKLAEEEDAPLLCVVCPSKTLKKGKMLEVHLGSKDHKRRLTRFRAHITSAEFPSADLEMDARSVSSQLDALVLARLSLQTQLGGTVALAPSSTAAVAPTEVEAKAEEGMTEAEKLKAEAEKEGISKRQLLREKKHLKVASQRMAKKEKKERLKARAEKKGEELPAPTKPLKRKAPYIAPKPTKEQIAERQALKALKREAEALAAKKEVVPKDVVELKKEGKVDEHGEKMTPSKKEGNEGKGKREMTTKSASTPSKPTPTPKSATKPKPSTPQPSTPSSTSSKRKRPSSAEQPTTPAAAAAGSAKKQQQGGGSAKKDVGGAAGGGSVKKVKKVKVDA